MIVYEEYVPASRQEEEEKPLAIDELEENKVDQQSWRQWLIQKLSAFRGTQNKELVLNQPEMPHVKPTIYKLPEGAIFQGRIHQGLFHGYGELSDGQGRVYRGEWLKGVPHGQGKLTEMNGNTYQGQWEDGYQSGYGEYKCGNRKWHYKGEYRNSEFNGVGKLTIKGRETYLGNFLNNQRHGFGKSYEMGNGNFEGEFENDKKHGFGVFRSENLYLEGQWRNGVQHGCSRFKVLSNDSVVYSSRNDLFEYAYWINGELVKYVKTEKDGCLSERSDRKPEILKFEFMSGIIERLENVCVEDMFEQNLEKLNIELEKVEKKFKQFPTRFIPVRKPFD